jgi:hypothetical protein
MIGAVERAASIQLPAQYREFLLSTNGGEGITGVDTYFVLWPVQDLIRLNREYEVNEHALGLLLIGSNGGGEAFALDLREDGKQSLVSVPFVGMSLRNAVTAADSFDEFLKHSDQVDDELNVSSKRSMDRSGLEIFEIHPIILGGDPIDPANKSFLTREQHIAVVRYWNKTIREIRGSN